MTREEALLKVKDHVKNPNLIKHMLATEAVMRALAERFGEPADRWALAGLLHDIDWDQTANLPDQHGLIGAKILEDLGVDGDIVYAVKVHNERHGLPRISMMDKALYAADPVTGLIVAAALIHPEKKLAPIDAQFVINRFGEKSFAKGANREQIKSCTELGLELDEFIEIAITAMKRIATEIGL
jgi:putative nucleotidyltransferase with HDIG domain